MDWTIIVVAAIAAIPPTIFSIATLMQGRRTYETFNSKMDDMLRLTKETAFAAGVEHARDKHARDRAGDMANL